MEKTAIYVLAECLAYDRTADLTIHGAFTSLDKAKAIMLEKIEERFNYIKDDLCDDEEEWKQFVNARFWNTVEDSEHKVAWSDDDGDTVSKFFIDEVEVDTSSTDKEVPENDDLIEKIRIQLDKLNGCNLEEAVETIKKDIGNLEFVDSKIDDGCDENEDGDKYVKMDSYDLAAEGRSFYLRLYYGDRSRTMSCYEIWAI